MALDRLQVSFFVEEVEVEFRLRCVGDTVGAEECPIIIMIDEEPWLPDGYQLQPGVIIANVL